MRQIVNPGCRRTFVPGGLLSDLYGDKKGTKGSFGSYFASREAFSSFGADE